MSHRQWEQVVEEVLDGTHPPRKTVEVQYWTMLGQTLMSRQALQHPQRKMPIAVHEEIMAGSLVLKTKDEVLL